MDFGLAGRHCFVTGASAGIGRATALAVMFQEVVHPSVI